MKMKIMKIKCERENNVKRKKIMKEENGVWKENEECQY